MTEGQHVWVASLPFEGPNGEKVQYVSKADRLDGKGVMFIVKYEAGIHRWNPTGLFALTEEEWSEFRLIIPKEGWG